MNLMVEGPNTQLIRSAEREQRSRFSWAPAAANAAGLLALANLIGGVSDPDFAARALVVPLLMFTAGLGAGLYAIQQAQIRLPLELQQHQHADTYLRVAARNESAIAFKRFCEIKIEPLRMIFSESDLKAMLAQLYTNLVATQEQAIIDGDADVAKANAELETIQKRIDQVVRKERWANAIAIGLCTGAVLFAVLGPQLGARLQPAKPQPAVSVTLQ